MSLNTAIRGAQIQDGAVDTAQLADDGVTNAKLANISQGFVKVGGASDAPTDLDAKTDKQILIGDGTDVVSVAVSGDITITNVGVVAIGATKVTDAMINDDVATGLAGTGLTATNGVLAVDSIVDNVVEGDIKFENLSADIDASGYSGEHTLSNTPITNSVQLFLQGLLQEEGSGKDYTLTGSTIQFTTVPISGDIVLAHYILND